LTRNLQASPSVTQTIANCLLHALVGHALESASCTQEARYSKKTASS